MKNIILMLILLSSGIIHSQEFNFSCDTWVEQPPFTQRYCVQLEGGWEGQCAIGDDGLAIYTDDIAYIRYEWKNNDKTIRILDRLDGNYLVSIQLFNGPRTYTRQDQNGGIDVAYNSLEDAFNAALELFN